MPKWKINLRAKSVSLCWSSVSPASYKLVYPAPLELQKVGLIGAKLAICSIPISQLRNSSICQNKNVHDLINRSVWSREYFLSLVTKTFDTKTRICLCIDIFLKSPFWQQIATQSKAVATLGNRSLANKIICPVNFSTNHRLFFGTLTDWWQSTCNPPTFVTPNEQSQTLCYENVSNWILLQYDSFRTCSGFCRTSMFYHF